jgi:hypothetical protein
MAYSIKCVVFLIIVKPKGLLVLMNREGLWRNPRKRPAGTADLLPSAPRLPAFHVPRRAGTVKRPIEHGIRLIP